MGKALNNLAIAADNAAYSFRIFGRIIGEHSISEPQVRREIGIHFDILCDEHRAAAIVMLTVDDDGNLAKSVEL